MGTDNEDARVVVLTNLGREIASRVRRYEMFPANSVSDAYRREILRLYRVALEAVEGEK